MNKMPMTKKGQDELESELRRLKSEERPAIIRAIAEAREHGDLSENAEYHAARDRQSFVEGRIAELEDVVSRAEVIVADADTDEEASYRIVGAHEADAAAGRLSVTSPLSRALIGKSIGDVVEVSTPGGGKSYEVVKVRYS
ncbi:MAG: transcription elongation factor GreA [Rhodospirillales bacterium]|nr:transcription elongation factor GreA [Rhodospirillales bacterium]